MSTFTHLHLHTDRSALDSIIQPEKLIQRVKELEMDSVAITDHGVVSASILFYQKCKKHNVKPIIGCEFYLAPEDRFLREKIEGKPPYYHLVALAKNSNGVKQLYELSSRGYTEGFYYKPRIDISLLESIGKDLIILSGCAKGPVSWNIIKDKPDEAKSWAFKLKEIYGDDFYLEMMDHGLDIELKANVGIRKISKELDIPWVPTNDAHFLNKEDHYIHCLMMCIQLKQTLEDLTMRYPDSCYVKSPAEMISLFGEEACLRTLEIVDKVDIHLELGNYSFPEYLDG